MTLFYSPSSVERRCCELPCTEFSEVWWLRRCGEDRSPFDVARAPALSSGAGGYLASQEGVPYVAQKPALVLAPLPVALTLGFLDLFLGLPGLRPLRSAQRKPLRSALLLP